MDIEIIILVKYRYLVGMFMQENLGIPNISFGSRLNTILNHTDTRVFPTQVWIFLHKVEKRGRNTTPMLSLAWIAVLLNCRVGLRIYVIMKWTLRELTTSQRLQPPFKGKHVNRRVLASWRLCPPRASPWVAHMGKSKFVVQSYNLPRYKWVHQD